MFPVMTLVNAPPRASRPIASVAPLTTARVTTRVWRSRSARRWPGAVAVGLRCGGRRRMRSGETTAPMQDPGCARAAALVLVHMESAQPCAG